MASVKLSSRLRKLRTIFAPTFVHEDVDGRPRIGSDRCENFPSSHKTSGPRYTWVPVVQRAGRAQE